MKEIDRKIGESSEDTHRQEKATAMSRRFIIDRLRKVLLGTWNKIFDDEIFGRAAMLAFYWFLSLFPFLIIVTALLSFTPTSRNLEKWLAVLGNVLPPQAFTVVQQTFEEVAFRQRPGLLSLSILVLVWSSSTGMGAVITALNRAFDAQNSRAWWQERILAIVLTLGLMIFINSSLLLIFFGDRISIWMAHIFGYGATFIGLWDLIQWPVVILFVLVGIELIYYFAPNIRQRWNLFTPGAVFALCFWLIISVGFRFYVSRFGNYSAIYGTLGGVMLLLLWLYLTGLAILIGGVINSVTRKLI